MSVVRQLTPRADAASARNTVTFANAGFRNLMDAGASLDLPWAIEMDERDEYPTLTHEPS